MAVMRETATADDPEIRPTDQESVSHSPRQILFCIFSPQCTATASSLQTNRAQKRPFPLSAFHFHPIALSFTSRLASSSESAVSSSPGCLGVGRNNVDVSRFTLNHGILAPTTVTLLSCFYFPRWPFIGNHN